MARGWESKSVEDQLEAKENRATAPTAYERALEESKKKREMQALELQRERILSERTSSPLRRAALEAALADVEARIAAFN